MNIEQIIIYFLGSEMKIAYIDAQNVYLGMKTLWYIIDWKVFFEYLQRRYEVNQVKLFMWYIDKYQRFYSDLKKYWYILIFRKTQYVNEIIKGNIDSVLVLETVRDFYISDIDDVFLVTGDGDFDVLVEFLESNGKFAKLMCPNIKKTSKLLKEVTPRNKIQDMATLLHIIGKKIV